MTTLVTGGTGAIGSWVLRRLIEQEGQRPVAFDTRPDFTLLSDLSERFDFVQGDILDLGRILRTINEHEIDRIIHLAAALPTREAEHPMTAFKVNAEGTLNVLEAAVVTKLDKVVYTSSKGVFGSFTGVHSSPTYEPMTEDLPKQPVGMYDLTKLTSEHLLDFYYRNYGLEYAVLRFPLLYGPGRLARHGALAVVSRLVENAMAGEPTILAAGADWEDELLYTRDVAQGIVRAAVTDGHEHRAFHIGRCTIESLRDVADAVRKVFPDARIELGPGSFRAEPRACRFDYSRARSELGYEPEFDLESGIADYVDFMRRLDVPPMAS